MDDRELLSRYVDLRSEEAFGELVARHAGVIHGAVLRQVGGDAHLAQDVVQRVFVALVRKAPALRERAALIGWLYTCARLEAARAVRTEARRRRRETEAHLMDTANDETALAWEALAPRLDEAMARLGATDREAVLLRFFSGRSFAEIAQVFAVTEDTARKRVERALEKLRRTLARRGLVSSVATLGTTLGAHAATTLPAGLAPALATHALGAVAAASPAVAQLALFMTLKQIGAGLAAAVIVAATGVAVRDLWIRRELAQAETREAATTGGATRTMAVVNSTPPVAARVTGNAGGAMPAPATGESAPASPAPAAARSYLRDPVYQRAALRASLARDRLEYQRLYRQLGLTAEQIQRFEEIMAIQNQATLDGQAVRDAGGDPQTVYRHSGPEWSTEMTALLGEAGFTQLKDYLRTKPVRAFVDSFAGYAAAIGEGFTAEQADRLAEAALAQDATYHSGRGTDPGTVNWPAVWPAAAGIMSPRQLATFQAMVNVWVGNKELQKSTAAASSSTR